MRRRDFLKSSASFSGAMLLGAGGRTFGQTPRTTRIGLQLYSVRNSLAKDPWGTLKEFLALVTIMSKLRTIKRGLTPGLASG